MIQRCTFNNLNIRSNSFLYGLEAFKVIVSGGTFVIGHGGDFEFSLQVIRRMKLSEVGGLLVLKPRLSVSFLEKDSLGSGIFKF